MIVPQSILMRDATPNLNIDHIPLRQDREDAPPRGTDEQCVIINTRRKSIQVVIVRRCPQKPHVWRYHTTPAATDAAVARGRCAVSYVVS